MTKPGKIDRTKFPNLSEEEVKKMEEYTEKVWLEKYKPTEAKNDSSANNP